MTGNADRRICFGKSADLRLIRRGIAALACILAPLAARATDYYVDSVNGNDQADGRTEQTPWQSLRKVNRATLQPGDRIRFKRGGLWRGQLHPRSGEPGKPVLYGAYGTGAKPILQQSADRSAPSDWEQVKPGIWATHSSHPTEGTRLFDLSSCDGWSSSFQEGVQGTFGKVTENDETFLRATCTRQPLRKSNLIQLWGPGIEDLPPYTIFKLKVRATRPFPIGGFALSLNHPPWANGWTGNVFDGPSQTEQAWQTVSILLVQNGDLERVHPHFSIGDRLEEGATFDFIPLGFWSTALDPSRSLDRDIGIFICNHGEKWGVKKWRPDDLKQPLDYWYDPAERRVLVRFDTNPGEAFDSIELAKTSHVIEEGGRHDVIYENLQIRYTGAHGIGGGNTCNITVRDCDIYWIGGGLQFWNTSQNGTRYPVRYGNGIEFWAGCKNNLVERNRLWQIYDAALTNQTKDSPQHETDIIWRDNVIWQAEYSFEYWNHDPSSFTGNILFEHNTCIDAGYGWAHTQRPDKNGAHLMFYDNAAPTTNFVVRNNIFVRTTDRSTRMFNDWRKGLLLQNNLYFIPENKIFEYHAHARDRASDPNAKTVHYPAGPEAFARYQREMGMDEGSIFAEPQFVDPANHDYRLKPGTVGTKAATDGGPVGARQGNRP